MSRIPTSSGRASPALEQSPSARLALAVHRSARGVQSAARWAPTLPSMIARIDRRPWAWLLLGALLVPAAHLRLGIGVLALFAPVALLRFLRLAPGCRARAALVAARVVAWSLAVVKIATAPIPVALAPMFGAPIAALQAAAYLGWIACIVAPRPRSRP